MPTTYHMPEKMKEYHAVCVRFKKLKTLLSNRSDHFCKKVLVILPEASKKFEIYKKMNSGKKTCDLEYFLKTEIDFYFHENFKKCATYLAWKKKIKKTF